jgi:hypothetical protein
MANPGIVNLNVYQGDRFELLFRLRSQVFNAISGKWESGGYLDLTGVTVKSQLRLKKEDTTVAAEFTCTVADQTVADTKGAVLCVLTPAQTALLAAPAYYYDVQVTSGPDAVTTYLQGQVMVTPEVTRA